MCINLIDIKSMDLLSRFFFTAYNLTAYYLYLNVDNSILIGHVPYLNCQSIPFRLSFPLGLLQAN